MRKESNEISHKIIAAPEILYIVVNVSLKKQRYVAKCKKITLYFSASDIEDSY